MKKKIRYTDESIGEIAITTDFLPAPKDLDLKDETRNPTAASPPDTHTPVKK